MERSGRGLIEGTEKNHKKLNQDIQFPGRDLNLGLPEYEAITARRGRSVQFLKI
jgi:hypothetical protein